MKNINNEPLERPEDSSNEPREQNTIKLLLEYKPCSIVFQHEVNDYQFFDTYQSECVVLNEVDHDDDIKLLQMAREIESATLSQDEIDKLLEALPDDFPIPSLEPNKDAPTKELHNESLTAEETDQLLKSMAAGAQEMQASAIKL
jgi:hypothetical protein